MLLSLSFLSLSFILLINIFSDCHYLAACSRDDTIKIIDLRTNQTLASLEHDNYKVACDFARISFNSDSSYVAAGAADGTIFIWNVNGILKTTLKEHT
jgi:autophagy-related protein 16-1